MDLENGFLAMTALFAYTDEDRWRPGIGDPTFTGWLTVVAYFATAYLCWRAAAKASMNKKEKWFWTGLTALMVFLGLNKQLDLQTALTFIGRDLAKAGGWYENRRIVQGIFVVGIGLGGIAITTGLVWTFRRELKRLRLAFIGLGCLVCFVVIRAASFHYIDSFLKMAPLGLRMNAILELGAIALIAWPAWRAVKRSSETGFVWVSGGGARGPDSPPRVKVR